MKEYMGNAINIALVEDDNGKTRTLKAVAEIVILVSEPVFRADASGHMTRMREMDQFRFGASLKALRGLIEQLGEYVTDMEDAESRFIEKPADA